MADTQNQSTGSSSPAGSGAGKALSDNPRQSIESGDPKETGRSHGRIVDDKGTPAGEPPGSQSAGNAGNSGKTGKTSEAGPKGNTGKIGQDFESGRQDTL